MTDPSDIQHATDALNETATAILAAAGYTPEQWARANDFTDDRWYGDRCGCTDDRCIGFHHSAEDDCGCLPVLLEWTKP